MRGELRPAFAHPADNQATYVRPSALHGSPTDWKQFPGSGIIYTLTIRDSNQSSLNGFNPAASMCTCLFNAKIRKQIKIWSRCFWRIASKPLSPPQR